MSTAETSILITAHALQSSRHAGFHAIAETLAEDGHRVTMVSWPRVIWDVLRGGDLRGRRLAKAATTGMTQQVGKGVIHNVAFLSRAPPPSFAARLPRWSARSGQANRQRALRWLNRHVPDPAHVFVESNASVFLAEALAAQYPRATLVYRPSDPILARPDSHPALRDAERQTIARADRVLLVNEQARATYAQAGWIAADDPRLRVLPNGLDLAVFRAEHPLPTELSACPAPRCVYVGASPPNWDAVLAAADAHADVSFVVVCPVVPARGVVPTIRARANLTWVPGVPSHRVAAFVVNAEAVMVPYPHDCRTWARGYHAKLHQAMAARRPIVGLYLGQGLRDAEFPNCDSIESFVREIPAACRAGAINYRFSLDGLDWSDFRARLRQYLADPPCLPAGPAEADRGHVSVP